MHPDDLLDFLRLYVLGCVHSWNDASSAHLDAADCQRYALGIVEAVWPCLITGKTLYGAHSDLTCEVWLKARRILAPHLANPQP